jgi:hypothetical protein
MTGAMVSGGIDTSAVHPLKLYKYIDRPYGDLLIEGRLRFSSISWFRHFDDPERGDFYEGTLRFAPKDGLEVQNHTRLTRFIDRDRMFTAAARSSDYIFAFAVSTELSGHLWRKFAPLHKTESTCVEIFDVERFAAHIQTTLRKRSPVQARTFRQRLVHYRAVEEPPEHRWALPDELAFLKEDTFSDQHEYRFLFSPRKHAYKFQDVRLELVAKNSTPVRAHLDSAKHCIDLSLGAIADCVGFVPPSTIPGL